MQNEKVYQMRFAKIYPLLVNKVVRKGRTEEEEDDGEDFALVERY